MQFRYQPRDSVWCCTHNICLRSDPSRSGAHPCSLPDAMHPAPALQLSSPQSRLKNSLRSEASNIKQLRLHLLAPSSSSSSSHVHMDVAMHRCRCDDGDVVGQEQEQERQQELAGDGDATAALRRSVSWWSVDGGHDLPRQQKQQQQRLIGKPDFKALPKLHRAHWEKLSNVKYIYIKCMLNIEYYSKIYS